MQHAQHLIRRLFLEETRMPHKPRGVRHRLASPTQMARLKETFRLPDDQPTTFGVYRRAMRRRHNPAYGQDKELKSYAHEDTKTFWAICAKCAVHDCQEGCAISRLFRFVPKDMPGMPEDVRRKGKAPGGP